MRITSIKIKQMKDKGLTKALASIVLDDAICINNIRVIEGDKELFISFPSRKCHKGGYFDIAHPIRTETREKIQKAILEEYNETINNKG